MAEPSGGLGHSVFPRQSSRNHSIRHRLDALEARQEDKGPDLSAAGSTMTSEEWAKEYLLRKTDKDGKKHKKPYKGSEKDLETIVEWLMGLESS